LLTSGRYARKHNLDVKAVILSYDDYEQKPVLFNLILKVEFTTSPTYSIQNCLKKINLNVDDVDYFEINEAFSVVALVNQKLLNIDINKLNINGGAVPIFY
jgi:acetyl-CoA C-acetyltransferase